MSGPLSYKRTVLHGCDFFEIVECEWNEKSVSAQHSHGWSQCAVLIKEGVFENRAEFGLKTELAVYEPGQTILTPLGVEHEIKCLSTFGKTLHVYMPRIRAAAGEAENFNPGSLSDLRRDLDLKLNGPSVRWVEVEKILAQIGRCSISTDSPMFMNQLFSGILPETLAAENVAARARTTLATFEASPAFTAVELEVVEQLGRLIGWKTSDGIGVPGGSAANFMAVHCARQKRVPDFRKVGSRGERFRIFTSSESHYSLKKACLATGIGTDSLIEIAVDNQGRMDPAALRTAVQHAKTEGAIPLMVCATAGTTVLGAFDPIDQLADICREFDVWLHVDGAWGGPALFSDRARPLVRGIERADSMTFDAHKLFGAGLTCSFFLNRHEGLLQQANDVAGGGYIFHSGEVTEDRGRLSWQCGRGADSLSFWTLWKSLGQEGLGAFVDRLFALRDESVKWIQTQPRLTLVSDPSYLNICVRVQPPQGQDPDWSKKIREQFKADGFAMVNYSRDPQGTFLRLILANPRLDQEHIQSILVRALAFK